MHQPPRVQLAGEPVGAHVFHPPAVLNAPRFEGRLAVLVLGATDLVPVVTGVGLLVAHRKVYRCWGGVPHDGGWAATLDGGGRLACKKRSRHGRVRPEEVLHRGVGTPDGKLLRASQVGVACLRDPKAVAARYRRGLARERLAGGVAVWDCEGGASFFGRRCWRRRRLWVLVLRNWFALCHAQRAIVAANAMLCVSWLRCVACSRQRGGGGDLHSMAYLVVL
eukprot:1855083-Rhodomonas_salina.2